MLASIDARPRSTIYDPAVTNSIGGHLDAHLPTDADVVAYHKNGYWVSPPIVPESILDAAADGMRRHHAGDVDAYLPTRDDELWGWRGGEGLRANNYTSARVKELGALVRYNLIAAYAARLAGSGSIRLWHDQLLYKPPTPDSAGNVGWHTDRQYWTTCSSTEMLTAWVPFHDITAQHGPVMFLPGSHRWETDDGLSFFDHDLTTIDALIHRHDVRPISATMRRGQVSFHHCRTIHGSGPNRGDEPRRSLAIHMQPGDNHWLRSVAPDGSAAAHSVDTLVRRVDEMPDYADPRICPQPWPSQT